jgi:hypothetical protein
MPGPARTILDNLGKQTLRRLCEERGLQTARELDEMRARLAHSFRGDTKELVDRLSRREMQQILDIWEFEVDGNFGGLVGVSYASKDDLAKAVLAVYEDGWCPTSRKLSPVGSGSRLRVSIDDETDLEDCAHEPEAENGRQTEEDAAQPFDDDRERSFLADLASKLAERGRTTTYIRRLVNDLGRHRAEHRLRLSAVRHVSHVLEGAGMSTDPDLSTMTTAPGIDARVVVIRSIASPRRMHDSAIAPDVASRADPPPGNMRIRPPSAPSPAPPPQRPSGFEMANEQLKFLVTVATSISILNQEGRAQAIEMASESIELSAADRIRLKAFSHQYAGGNFELGHTLGYLRAGLSERRRQQLLDCLPLLAPACQALDEAREVYAVELGVQARIQSPPPPVPPDTPEIASPVQSNKAEPASEGKVEAGGVRQNEGLDSVFGKGG